MSILFATSRPLHTPIKPDQRRVGVPPKTGKKIEWDSAALKAKNCPEADAYLRREYRKGWSL